MMVVKRWRSGRGNVSVEEPCSSLNVVCVLLSEAGDWFHFPPALWSPVRRAVCGIGCS